MPESVRRIAGVGLGAGEAVKLSGSFASHMPHPNLLFELGRSLSLGLRRAAATLRGQNRYPPIAKTDRGAPGGGIKPKGHGSSQCQSLTSKHCRTIATSYTGVTQTKTLDETWNLNV